MSTTTKKRLLVTGGGGFIGHHLIKRLKADGHWVRGVDLKCPEYETSPADEFEVLDLRRWEDCVAATRGGITGPVVDFCDPSGCGDPQASVCDDDNVCTLGKTCQANGSCGDTPLDCLRVPGRRVRSLAPAVEERDACQDYQQT